MTADDLLRPAASRPPWLVTLADLALLLVGFLVLVQATEHRVGGAALARGLPARFAGEDAPALPVAAVAVPFAPASADLVAAPSEVVAWTRQALADPRVAVTVTGATDGSVADVDHATGSAAMLAADRARAVVAALAAARLPVNRLSIATASPAPGRRSATLTLAFVGEHRSPEQP